jgi:hypothetical protein
VLVKKVMDIIDMVIMVVAVSIVVFIVVMSMIARRRETGFDKILYKDVKAFEKSRFWYVVELESSADLFDSLTQRKVSTDRWAAGLMRTEAWAEKV